MNWNILEKVIVVEQQRENYIVICTLFITTSQPLELTLFNSINKLLTIWYFESFSTSFYLLFFSYMLHNSKWSKKFQACSQLALKNEFKELQPFWTSFHNNLTLWSATKPFFARPKKRFFVTSNANIFQYTWWKFRWKFRWKLIRW